MKIFAIDPGPVESGWCIWDTAEPHLLWKNREWKQKKKIFGKPAIAELGEPPFGKIDNRTLVGIIQLKAPQVQAWAIESVASYGMRVGKEVFDTCKWVGRFEVFIHHCQTQTFPSWEPLQWPLLMPRTDVKMYLTGRATTKDSDIRASLIERFGSQGKKDTPGVLYGISKDSWSAVALAVATQMRLQERGMLPKQ